MQGEATALKLEDTWVLLNHSQKNIIVDMPNSNQEFLLRPDMVGKLSHGCVVREEGKGGWAYRLSNDGKFYWAGTDSRATYDPVKNILRNIAEYQAQTAIRPSSLEMGAEGFIGRANNSTLVMHQDGSSSIITSGESYTPQKGDRAYANSDGSACFEYDGKAFVKREIAGGKLRYLGSQNEPELGGYGNISEKHAALVSDGKGNVIIADLSQNGSQVVAPDGKIIRLCGGETHALQKRDIIYLGGVLDGWFYLAPDGKIYLGKQPDKPSKPDEFLCVPPYATSEQAKTVRKELVKRYSKVFNQTANDRTEVEKMQHINDAYDKYRPKVWNAPFSNLYALGGLKVERTPKAPGREIIAEEANKPWHESGEKAAPARKTTQQLITIGKNEVLLTIANLDAAIERHVDIIEYIQGIKRTGRKVILSEEALNRVYQAGVDEELKAEYAEFLLGDEVIVGEAENRYDRGAARLDFSKQLP
ncbi:Uncharacterised protein [uncultured archaeon]|nr:Uncharacterised protein [uncultured archaeon]